MTVQIYIIFDNNSFLLKDLNIQSDKHELLKSVFGKGHLCGLNILYLTELAIILDIFIMGLLLRKSPQQNETEKREKSPQDKTPQTSPVEKTPQLILQSVEKSPHHFWDM